MAIYAIADTHLSFGCEKPMDIFAGWSNYVERLEQNWRAAVREDDTVVLPGDISWGMSLEDALPDFAFLHSLPGTKIIMKGNHDYWWNSRRKIEDLWTANGLSSLRLLHNNAFAAEGFALCGSRGWFFDSEEAKDGTAVQKIILREAGRLRTSIQAGKQLLKAAPEQPQKAEHLLVFLHYPPIANGRVCAEMMDVLLSEEVTRCYYGHLHGQSIKWAHRGAYEGIQFELISADALQFAPKRIAWNTSF